MTTPKEKQEADSFAGDTLIAPLKYRSYIQGGDFSEVGIRRFAEQIKVYPM